MNSSCLTYGRVQTLLEGTQAAVSRPHVDSNGHHYWPNITVPGSDRTDEPSQVQRFEVKSRPYLRMYSEAWYSAASHLLCLSSDLGDTPSYYMPLSFITIQGGSRSIFSCPTDSIMH